MRVRGAPLIGVDRGVRRLPRAARRRLRCRARGGLRRAARHAPDGRQPRLGARRDARGARRGRARASASRARTRRPPRSRTRTSRPAARSASTARGCWPSCAARRDGAPVQVLTHCNAGWLATVDWGTALAPGLRRVRARDPAACLGRRDAAAQPGREPHRLGARRSTACRTRWSPTARAATCSSAASVDLVLVGSDRITRDGDVCNKIGTYPEGARGARQRRAVLRRRCRTRRSTGASTDGVAQIPIEERAASELRLGRGPHAGRRARRGRDPAGRRARRGTSPST